MTYSDAIMKRIKQLCAARKITLNKLATLAGIQESTLDRMQRGKSTNPTLKTLHRISIALGMTVSELLDFPEMNEGKFDNE